MKLRTLYYHIPFAAAFCALPYFAFWRENIYALGIFSFLTWALLFMLLCTLPERAALIVRVSYRAGKHAPAWLDFITYFVPILFCAAFNNYAKAAAWAVMCIIDFIHREKSKLPEKDTNANN